MVRFRWASLMLGVLVMEILTGTSLGQDRISTSQKGSVLIIPKIELRWRTYGLNPFFGPTTLAQDTYLTISNDYPEDVYVHMYFLNGDPPTNSEPGWNWIDCSFILTANQPLYMAMSTGDPLGCVPFTFLDPPSGPALFPRPGRPDPEAPGFRMLRGMAYVWAEGFDASLNEFRPISWDHLQAEVSFVDYRNATVTKYNAYAAQAVDHADGPHNGDFVGSPGAIRLDGIEYQSVFSRLTFNFFSVGSRPYQGPGRMAEINNDLTFHPVSVDFRQDGNGPICTKLPFDIWNQDEIRLSGTERCLCCWDQTLMSNYGIPNLFLVSNLITNMGRSRVQGIASSQVFCPDAIETPILGLLIERQTFLNSSDETPVTNGTSVAAAEMTGQGEGAAFVLFDPTPGADE